MNKLIKKNILVCCTYLTFCTQHSIASSLEANNQNLEHLSNFPTILDNVVDKHQQQNDNTKDANKQLLELLLNTNNTTIEQFLHALNELEQQLNFSQTTNNDTIIAEFYFKLLNKYKQASQRLQYEQNPQSKQLLGQYVVTSASIILNPTVINQLLSYIMIFSNNESNNDEDKIKDIVEKFNEYNKLQQENSKLKEQQQTLEEDYDVMVSVLNNQREITEAVSPSQIEYLNSESEYQTQINELENSIASIVNTFTNLIIIRDKTSTEQNNLNLQQILQNATFQLDITKNLKNTMNELYETQQIMQENINNLTSTNCQLKQQLEQTQLDNQKLNDEISQNATEKAHLQKTADTLKQSVNSRQKTINDLNDQITKLNQSTQKYQKLNEQLQNDLTELKGNTANDQQTINSLRNQIEQLTKLNQLTEKYETLNKELETELITLRNKTKNDQQTIDNLNNQITKLNQSNQSLQEYERSIEKLTGELNILKSNAENNQQTINNQMTKLNELETQCETLKEENNKLTEQLGENEMIKQIQNLNQLFEKHIQKQEKSIQEQEKSIIELQTQLQRRPNEKKYNQLKNLFSTCIHIFNEIANSTERIKNEYQDNSNIANYCITTLQQIISVLNTNKEINNQNTIDNSEYTTLNIQLKPETENSLHANMESYSEDIELQHNEPDNEQNIVTRDMHIDDYSSSDHNDSKKLPHLNLKLSKNRNTYTTSKSARSSLTKDQPVINNHKRKQYRTNDVSQNSESLSQKSVQSLQLPRKNKIIKKQSATKLDSDNNHDDGPFFMFSASTSDTD